MAINIEQMTVGKVASILALASDQVIADLAGCVVEQNPGITVIKSPQAGLIMMRALESVENIAFNLGEILVTECTVARGEEEIGWGCCLGDNQERAFHLAVLDLTWEYLPEQCGEMVVALAAEEERVLREDAVLTSIVDSTRVRFEVA